MVKLTRARSSLSVLVAGLVLRFNLLQMYGIFSTPNRVCATESGSWVICSDGLVDANSGTVKMRF